jgi:hypothetical protein
MAAGKSTKAAPPAAAVERDPHWAAKMEKLRNRSLVERQLRVVLDDTVGADHAVAVLELEAAKARHEREPDEDTKADVEKAERLLEERTAELDEHSIVLTFRALPRPEYEALQLSHPPTEEQKKDPGGAWAYNPDTFTPACIAACSVDGLTYDEVVELLAKWSAGEAATLWQTVEIVNKASRLQFVR